MPLDVPSFRSARTKPSSHPLSQPHSPSSNTQLSAMGSRAAADNRTLLVLGAGPGIGRSVTTLFASKRYNKVALIARRAEQLRAEKEAVESAVPGVRVEIYAVDLTNTDALTAVLDQADSAFGKPEAVFYNAARVVPSELFVHPVEDIEYDFKVRTCPSMMQLFLPRCIVTWL